MIKVKYLIKKYILNFYLILIKKNFLNILIGLFIFNFFGTNCSFLKAEDDFSSKQYNLSVDYLDKKNDTEYILGPGDILQINISRQLSDLNKTQMINGDGEIILPKLKSIYVAGLTLRELNKLLDIKLRDYFKYPELEIYIVGYRNVNFSIIGEIERPGLYSLRGSQQENVLASKKNFEEDFIEGSRSSGLINDFSKQFKNAYFPTVLDGIREAGGITSRSDLSNIEIIRKNSISKGGGLIKTSLNLLAMLDTGNASENIRLLDGDIIKIKKSDDIFPEQLAKAVRSNINPRFIKVFVIGRVVDPGPITVSRSSSLNDAILLAGGAKVIKGPIKFVRYRSDGTIESRKFTYNRKSKRGSYKNPLLKTGDIISVNRNIVNVATELLEEVTKPFIGVYAAKEVFEKF